MKKTILQVIFILVYLSSCKHKELINDRYFLIDVKNEKINFKKYIEKNDIRIIYFYNQNTCESCFLGQVNNLKELSKKDYFMIVTNFHSQRELLSFQNNFELNNVFISKSDFFNKSFYFNVLKNNMITPNLSTDNEDNISLFLKEFL